MSEFFLPGKQKCLTFRAININKLLNYKAQDPAASGSSALDEARYMETLSECQQAFSAHFDSFLTIWKKHYFASHKTAETLEYESFRDFKKSYTLEKLSFAPLQHWNYGVKHHHIVRPFFLIAYYSVISTPQLFHQWNTGSAQSLAAHR